MGPDVYNLLMKNFRRFSHIIFTTVWGSIVGGLRTEFIMPNKIQGLWWLLDTILEKYLVLK